MEGKNEVLEKRPEELSVAIKVLAKRIGKWTGNKNQVDTAIPGLRLSRWESPTEPTSYIYAKREYLPDRPRG